MIQKLLTDLAVGILTMPLGQVEILLQLSPGLPHGTIPNLAPGSWSGIRNVRVVFGFLWNRSQRESGGGKRFWIDLILLVVARELLIRGRKVLHAKVSHRHRLRGLWEAGFEVLFTVPTIIPTVIVQTIHTTMVYHGVTATSAIKMILRSPSGWRGFLHGYWVGLFGTLLFKYSYRLLFYSLRNTIFRGIGRNGLHRLGLACGYMSLYTWPIDSARRQLMVAPPSPTGSASTSSSNGVVPDAPTPVLHSPPRYESALHAYLSVAASQQSLLWGFRGVDLAAALQVIHFTREYLRL